MSEETDWAAFDQIMDQVREAVMGEAWTKPAIAAFQERLKAVVSEEHAEATEDFYRLVDMIPPKDEDAGGKLGGD